MPKNNFPEILKYLLVIGAGLFTYLQFSFFQPFTAQYPPSVAYQVMHGHKNRPDTVLAAAGAHYKKNWLGQFLLGKHYRFFWQTPVKVPVLHINSETGGLRISKRGGGMQTTSFTLKDREKVSYSLRSVDKDPITVIPPWLWKTYIGTFIRDQIAATDPYALRPVLFLSGVAGIMQAEAKLVFVRKDDAAFKPYHLPGNGLYYLSRSKPVILRNDTLVSANGRFYDSPKMLRSLAKNPNFRIDTAAFLKCRLFDLFIGDWDRHNGQWDWLGFKAQNDTVFVPVPKDRDQAFGYYADGIFPFLFTRNFGVRKITSLSSDYDDIEGFSQNGADLDSRFLKRLPIERFDQSARELQQLITDKALKEAVMLYPPPVREMARQQRLPVLISRRDKLAQAARIYAAAIKDAAL